MRALVALCGLTTCLAAVLPASAPGGVVQQPEGFGSGARGGLGGRRLTVTSLADSGPGTLRAAIEASGPRTVEFEVAGLVTLETPLVVHEPFLTLDGSNAPGDGVCVRGSEVSIRAHDVIVRYMRFRPGDISGKEVDALNVAGDAHDVVIDHVSASWGVDEDLSPSGAIHDVTVSWSIIAEGLDHSVHSKGAHGYGSLVRAIGGVTLHHNLWAHNASRNPRLGDNYGTPPWPTFDVRNNVIYDYGGIASGMTGDHLSANYVGNYIRPGPSSDTKRGPIVLTDTAAVNYFVEGNVVDGRDELTADNRKLFDKPDHVTVAARAFSAPPVKTTSARDALRDVLAGAGATRPRRDAVDARIVRDVEQRTGRIIDSQKDVGGWPAYKR